MMTRKAKKEGVPTGSKRSRVLDEVLLESKRIKATVARCGDDVSSVNAILNNELETPDPQSEIGNALEKSRSVESSLHDASQQMSNVNKELGKEVRERQTLEQKLLDSEEKERQARHAAFHDPLTGLPNRTLFDERLEHGLEQAKRHGWQFAVMFLDLDGFKGINDTYGHAAGDQLLQCLAQRLRASTRADDTVCRVGGDEFLYLLMEVRNRHDITALVEKLLKLIQAPCRIDGHTVVVRASIGIAVFPKNGATPHTLVKHADAAMYHAKRSKSGFSFAA